MGNLSYDPITHEMEMGISITIRGVLYLGVVVDHVVQRGTLATPCGPGQDDTLLLPGTEG